MGGIAFLCEQYCNNYCWFGVYAIMLRLLGQSEYGLYSLVGSIVGYLSVLDMGLGDTVVRYTARNRADETKKKEAELKWPISFRVLNYWPSSIIGRIYFIC